MSLFDLASPGDAEDADSGKDAPGKDIAAVGTKSAPPQQRPGKPLKQLQKVEKEINRLEAQLQELEEESAQCATDYQKLMEIEEQKENLNSALMDLYEKWEALDDGA